MTSKKKTWKSRTNKRVIVIGTLAFVGIFLFPASSAGLDRPSANEYNKNPQKPTIIIPNSKSLLGVKEDLHKEKRESRAYTAERVAAEQLAQQEAERVAAEQEAERIAAEAKEVKAAATTSGGLTPSGYPAEVWSSGQVYAEAYRVAINAGKSQSEADWVASACARLAMAESGGRTDARNPSSSATGILQFLAAWTKGCEVDWRTDPYASIGVFVGVYLEGGQAKIKQHWAQTY